MSLRRLLLLLPVTMVLLAAGAWYWLLHTEAGAEWIWSQVVSASDGALHAKSISGDLSSGVVGSRITFGGDGVNVSIAEVSLAVNFDVMPLRVTVEPARVSNLLIDLGDKRDTDDGSNLRETLAKLQLPLELVVPHLEIENASIADIGDKPELAVETATFSVWWEDEIVVERIAIATPLVNATGTGRLALHGENDVFLDTHLVAHPELTGLDDAVAITATVQGPLENLTLQALADEPRTLLRGRIVGITDEIRWDLQLDAPELDLAQGTGISDLPIAALTANGHGDLRVFAAEAQVRFPGTDMRVTVAAEVDVEATTVSSDVDWSNAHWPVGELDPRVRSPIGKVTLTGSLDDWNIAGTVDIAVPQLPPGRFTIDGGGNREGASAEIVEGNVLGGTVAGRAGYRWRTPKSFTANLELESVRTAAVLPDWPATLTGELTIAGKPEPFELSAILTNVSGELMDRPLIAEGRVDVREGAVSFDGLRIQHGDTKAHVDGELYAIEGLGYEISIDEIAHYVDNAQGSLSAIGTLSLNPGKQFLHVSASSDTLEYGDLAISNLTIDDRSSADGIFNADIAIDGLTIGDAEAGPLQAQARIGRQTQTVDVDLVTRGLHSGLSVTGALDSWEQPSSWAGQITRIELDHSDFSVALEDTVALDVSDQYARLDRMCIVGARGAGLCVAGGWHDESGFDVAADLAAVPVDLLNAFVESGFTFDQVVSGVFDWRANADGTSTGRADIAMTPGAVVSKDDPDLRIETGQARLEFDLDDDNLRGGIISLPFPELGQIAADFEVLDVVDDGTAEISGSISADLVDVGMLVALFPVLDDAGGSLQANIDIGGSVEAPLLTGNFELAGGSLSYLPIGLRLDDIELKSELQDDGEIELTGSFRAGEGRAEIHTRADHARTAATGLELTLRGQNLTVIDVPDIRAIANTDVSVNFDGESLNLDGHIDIPRARIRPSNIGVNSVYESADVVIVAGELPDEPTDDSADTDLQIFGSLEVSLGSDVVVDLEVAETRVTGSALFTWSGDPMPVANGRYDVDGEILAFGQRLEITEGSVRFENDPADNPYLRIRAEREIFGNTQVRQAGVLVAGALSRPSIEAYTTPVTTEERALTLLVTGSDFDYDKGIGAIDFGTYIAPRVYASYGIGLFDNENVIRVRYDLKRGFGITATSGQQESGVDLSYRFEN